MSQWISEGKIGPEAIIDGRIRVDIATTHLRERLDPAKRFGLNRLSTRLDAAPPAPSCLPQPRADSVENRIKREKLRQAELMAIRAEERDRLARGVYVLASAVREENGRLAAKIFEAFGVTGDGALDAILRFGRALAFEFKFDLRTIHNLTLFQLSFWAHQLSEHAKEKDRR